MESKKVKKMKGNIFIKIFVLLLLILSTYLLYSEKGQGGAFDFCDCVNTCVGCYGISGWQMLFCILPFFFLCLTISWALALLIRLGIAIGTWLAQQILFAKWLKQQNN
jgi:hypothetical protein